MPYVVETHVVKTDTESHSTRYSALRNLARAPDGTLWCVYLRKDADKTKIYCSYSVDGGENWTEEEIPGQPAENQREPAIAVDEDGNGHVSWTGLGWGVHPTFPCFNIQYCKRTGGVWSAIEHVTDAADWQTPGGLALDSESGIHFVWCGKTWGVNTETENIEYRYRSPAGVWGAVTSVTDVVNTQYEPALAVDSLDNVHVVWIGKGWGSNPTIENIQYRKLWEAQQAVTDKDIRQLHPTIAVDSNNNAHFAWAGKHWGAYTGDIQIAYTDSSFIPELVTNVAYDQFYPSIALDAANNIWVAWYGRGWGGLDFNNLVIRRRTVAGWEGNIQITDKAFWQSYPSLIWATHPQSPPNIWTAGCAFVWSGDDAEGYRVEFGKVSVVAETKGSGSGLAGVLELLT